jgi:hypothetical protein
VGVIGVPGRAAELAVHVRQAGGHEEGISLFAGGNCGET